MRRVFDLSRFTRSCFTRGVYLLGVAGFTLAASASTIGVQLESNDSFCASCHVEPETTYYQESLRLDEAPTLAAFHAGEKTLCIDCHRDQTWVSERPGHYHSPWLRKRWRATGGPANTCEACHPSHEMLAFEPDRFIDADLNEAQCDACH